MYDKKFKLKDRNSRQDSSFTSIFLYCQDKVNDKLFAVVEVSNLSILIESTNFTGADIETRYELAFLSLLDKTEEELIINFIDVEYEAAKKSPSKSEIN